MTTAIELRDGYDSLIELFSRLIEEADDEMRYLMHGDKIGDLMISAPSIIIEYFKKALLYKHLVGFAPGELGKLFVFRGITMYPSFDWAITLYHKEYSLYKKDWMIRKIPLNNPHQQKKEWYTKYTICLVDLFSIKSEDVSLN